MTSDAAFDRLNAAGDEIDRISVAIIEDPEIDRRHVRSFLRDQIAKAEEDLRVLEEEGNPA